MLTVQIADLKEEVSGREYALFSFIACLFRGIEFLGVITNVFIKMAKLKIQM